MDISVMLIAYNHERYIRQAIESVLMQRNAPEFEIVIGEDQSTDNTRTIIKTFTDSYPNKIKAQFSKTNIGTTKNYMRTLRNCRGKYVAVLDGDDYWTDPDKLSKQSKFLDQNPSCSISFHNVKSLYEDEEGRTEDYVSEDQKPLSSLVELLSSNFIPTCSVMFRNHLFTDVPDWYYQMKMSDYPIHVFNAQHGLIGYIGETMATYRIHSGGYWGKIAFEKQLRADIEFFTVLSSYLPPGFSDVIDKSLQKRYYGLSLCLKEKALQEGSIAKGIESVLSSLEVMDDSVKPTGTWISNLLSSIYVDYAFIGHGESKPQLVRFCLSRAFKHDPSWLRNRGVRSILLQAYLGSPARKLAALLP